MKKKIKISIIIIILLVIIVGLLASGTYASFMKQIIGESKTIIAEPVFCLEHTDKKVLDDANTEIDYYFTIKNYNSNKVNEVDLKYMIEITPKQDAAIVLTLYRGNEVIRLNDQKTGYINIGHTNQEKHDYRLNVKYDKSNLEESYDISSSIFIKASAIQN